MRVEHNLTLLDFTVLFEEPGNFVLRETRVDASDEQVGTRVDSTVILRRRATIILWATGRSVNKDVMTCSKCEELTGNQHDHYHLAKLSDGVDCHCDEQDAEKHCGHVRSVEHHLYAWETESAYDLWMSGNSSQ